MHGVFGDFAFMGLAIVSLDLDLDHGVGQAEIGFLADSKCGHQPI